MKVSFLQILIITLLVPCLQAQNVGIGTNTPDPSAKLDIVDPNRGLLIPRVSLIAVTNGTAPINAPAMGLLVYNNNASITGGNGTGFYYWDGSQWTRLMTAASNNWSLTGNAGTNPTVNFLGTTDNQDLVVRTNNTERMRVDAAGQVGVGTNAPNHRLHVMGDVRFEGDFINQDAIGSHSGTIQSVPFTNGSFNPLTGTTTSITITDGNGVNNSAVFISGFARVFGGNLNGGTSSLGGYFLILERSTDPAFGTSSILTYTSGTCYIETPTSGSGSASIGFGGGGHVSYLDDGLAPGTYYYRLVLYPNGVGINTGTYDVYQRDLSVLQIKR